MEIKPSEALPEKRMSDLEIGQRSTFSKTITESDVYLFAGLTADFNPIHVDREYAKTTQFGERIAHGFLVAALVQPCMSDLTTPGGVSLNYNFSMKEPVFFGDTITASAEGCEKARGQADRDTSDPLSQTGRECLYRRNRVESI